MRFELKVAILKTGQPQYRFAQKIGLHPAKLSSIITGYINPSEDEKEKIANTLGCSGDVIFTNVDFDEHDLSN